jgi:molecular chaperone GrpE
MHEDDRTPPDRDIGNGESTGSHGDSRGAGTVPDDQSLAELLADANDRCLRLQAELENIRKRARRELDDERRYANLPLLRDLLPVADNLARAIDSGEKSHDVERLLEGVKMVAQQLEAVFAKHHCKRIEAVGLPFDPHQHEAIAQQPSGDHPPHTVLAEAQSGFQLHDRVIRPSQVIVSKTDAD